MPLILPKNLPQSFIEKIKAYVSILLLNSKIDLKDSDIEVVLGGSTAWKLYQGAQWDELNDLDIYFILPKNRNVNLQMFGLTIQDTLKPRPFEKFDTRDSYYQYSHEKIDFNFRYDGFGIWSNFQIGVHLTGKINSIYVDPKNAKTHEEDFLRFANEKIIISYDLHDLITRAAANPVEHNESVRTLAFVLKSYIQPLNIPGMHFDLETARAIMSLESKANRSLWTMLKKRLVIEPYSLDIGQLVKIFDVAQESLDIGERIEKEKKEIKINALTGEVNAQKEEKRILMLQNETLTKSLGDVQQQKSDLQKKLDASEENLKDSQFQMKRLEEQHETSEGAISLMTQKHEKEKQNHKHEVTNKDKQLHKEKSKNEELLAIQEQQHKKIEELNVLLKKERTTVSQKANELQKQHAQFEKINHENQELKKQLKEKISVREKQPEMSVKILESFLEYLNEFPMVPKSGLVGNLATTLQLIDRQYEQATHFNAETRLAHYRDFFTKRLPTSKAMKNPLKKELVELLLAGLSVGISDTILPPPDATIVQQCYAGFLWVEKFAQADGLNHNREKVAEYFHELKKHYPNVKRDSSLINLYIDNLRNDLAERNMKIDLSHPIFKQLCSIFEESPEILNDANNDKRLIDEAIIELATSPLFPLAKTKSGKVEQKALIDQLICILYFTETQILTEPSQTKNNIQRICNKLYAPTNTHVKHQDQIRHSQNNNNNSSNPEPTQAPDSAASCSIQ